MDNENLLKKLVEFLKMIRTIRNDDGYVMNRIKGIGHHSIELLKQLETDDPEQKVLISNTIEGLKNIDEIYEHYLNHPDQIKFIQRQSSHGNMDLFMKGIHCVEGGLEIFLSRVGWLDPK